MGKGGCFDVFEQGVGFIRGVMGCICCMLCVGPILIIVGIVMLVAPNNFQKNVDDYKTAITTFNNGNAVVMEQSTATMLGSTFGISKPTVPITGVNSGDIPVATSVVLGTLTTRDLTVSRTVSMTTTSGTTSGTNPNVNVSPSPFSGTNTYSGTVSSCSYSGSGSDTCSSKCQSKYGNNVGTSGNRNSGQCQWYQQWQYNCQPLALGTSLGASSWQVDTTLNSCDYITSPMGSYTSTGFGWQPLTISTSFVSDYGTIKFMANNDPYIVAQRLTKGSMDFGLTAAQQRGIGAALIAVGVIITVGVIAAFVCVKRMMNRDPRNGHAVYGAFGRTYQGSQGGYQQMPPQTYAQPLQQPGYQQAAYQQQPVYAAQPGYQQQPPPPQQPYGQPGYQQPYQQPQQQVCAV